MDLFKNIIDLQESIDSAEKCSERAPGSVLLLAVSKLQSSHHIRQAFSAGIHDFAESYLQEAEVKMVECKELPITWHYIGRIQSNKTKIIARDFAWVHSVDTMKIAERLNHERSSLQSPLNVCIQVNIDHESNKSGLIEDAVLPLALQIISLPHLKLRGLMCIPKFSADRNEHSSFQRMKSLQLLLNQQLPFTLDTLSMGMSNDYIQAIEAGSTIVRIGEAIFGQRREKAD